MPASYSSYHYEDWSILQQVTYTLHMFTSLKVLSTIYDGIVKVLKPFMNAL